jgi:hypothetical protein
MKFDVRYCPPDGPRSRYAQVTIEFIPAETTTFSNISRLPEEVVAQVEKGVMESLEHPYEVILWDGAVHANMYCFYRVGKEAVWQQKMRTIRGEISKEAS